MILLRISQRILIGFLQKNQYTYNVPPGSSNYIYTRGRRPSCDGTDGTGRTGRDGTDGTDGTEYQKCPLKIFILCGYIDKVYTYLYM